jgi:hypothetical protein
MHNDAVYQLEQESIAVAPLQFGIQCRIFPGRGDRMPTVKDFGGYRVTLYAEDHNPPHVHVIGPDFQAKVRIADAKVFAGAIPPRHRREALAWVAANRRMLMARWNELR